MIYKISKLFKLLCTFWYLTMIFRDEIERTREEKYLNEGTVVLKMFLAPSNMMDNENSFSTLEHLSRINDQYYYQDLCPVTYINFVVRKSN